MPIRTGSLAIFTALAMSGGYLFIARFPPQWSAYPTLVKLHQPGRSLLTQKGQSPFLHVSWFRFLDTRVGEDFAVYNDGYKLGYEFISRASQGAGSPMTDTAGFARLRQVSQLPQEPLFSGLIPGERLLFVTLNRDGQHTTRVYDREHLPREIQEIADIAGVERL